MPIYYSTKFRNQREWAGPETENMCATWKTRARHHHHPQQGDGGVDDTTAQPTILSAHCPSVLWFVQLESKSSILASNRIISKNRAQGLVISPQLLALQCCHSVPQDVHA